MYRTYYDQDTGEVIRHTCVEAPGTTFIFWYATIGFSFFYGVVLVTIGLLYRQVSTKKYKSVLTGEAVSIT